jgi:hypothetical protein
MPPAKRKRAPRPINDLADWLREHRLWVPAGWVAHIQGASRQAVINAMNDGRIRHKTIVFPSGHTVRMVALYDVPDVASISGRRFKRRLEDASCPLWAAAHANILAAAKRGDQAQELRPRR